VSPENNEFAGTASAVRGHRRACRSPARHACPAFLKVATAERSVASSVQRGREAQAEAKEKVQLRRRHAAQAAEARHLTPSAHRPARRRPRRVLPPAMPRPARPWRHANILPCPSYFRPAPCRRARTIFQRHDMPFHPPNGESDMATNASARHAAGCATCAAGRQRETRNAEARRNMAPVRAQRRRRRHKIDALCCLLHSQYRRYA